MYPSLETPEYGAFIKSQIDSVAAAGHDIRLLFIDGRESKSNYLAAVGNLRRILREQPCDLIHAHYGLSGAIAASQRGVPVVLSYCGDDLHGTSNGSGGITPGSRATVWIGQLVSLGVRKIILKSESMMSELKFRSAREKAVVIPNGVNFDLFRPMSREEARARLQWNTEGRRVLFPSAPKTPVKRFDMAMKAVELLRGFDPDVQLISLGGILQRDVPLYMNACDAMVLTSDSEGSPNVVKEAMACNLPIVSVDAGDAWQVMEGTSMCRRAERRSENVAENLRQVLETGGRSNGRDKIAHLELGTIANRVIAVYCSVVDDKVA